MAALVLPPWLECASSMMIAKVRPRCSFADLVEDEGETSEIVRDDDLLASLDEPPKVT